MYLKHLKRMVQLPPYSPLRYTFPGIEIPSRYTSLLRLFEPQRGERTTSIGLLVEIVPTHKMLLYTFSSMVMYIHEILE